MCVFEEKVRKEEKDDAREKTAQHIRRELWVGFFYCFLFSTLFFFFFFW